MSINLTKETIQLTRQWYADNAAACIEEVKNGKVKVNDPDKYDHSLGFVQRAVFIQTGECYALLP